jgi:hypothetical protein
MSSRETVLIDAHTDDMARFVGAAAIRQEFDRQVGTLVAKGYPKLAGLTEDVFRSRVEPLAALAPQWFATADDRIPFVVVVTAALVPTSDAVGVMESRGRTGFTRMEVDELSRFRPTEHVDVPAAAAYLAIDIDTGRDTLNQPPDAALPRILAAGRSPITIDEGVALLTHCPDLLKTHNCFSMLGSRCGDRRVTAFWTSAGRPRLGWCWAGAPHTWLGSASCGSRQVV